MSKLNRYWLWTLLGSLAVSAYPIYMGWKVIHYMAAEGSVPHGDFPKYIIPYTPIAIAVITAVLLMPLLIRLVKKGATLVASGISVGAFFAAELLFESKVIVTTTVATTLESWQMYMCYVPPQMFETRQWTAIDVLMGEYSPTFKLHFYLISVVLILAIVNCLYGFGKMLHTGKKERCRALAIQSVSTALFLGLCIFACFTAFFRNGELTVSPLSAFLMAVFFIALGATAGIFIGTFFVGKKKGLAVLLPAATASLVTLLMYIGEMFLLSFHLYRLGSGLFFEPLPGIVLAPADIGIILLSGLVTGVVCFLLNRNKQ